MFAREGLAPVDGTSLWYRRSGAGPAVVMLHGRGLDARLWDGAVAALRGRYTTVAYDLRGSGRSAAGDNAYSHAGDLEALLDHLGLDRVALVGLSMGGGAAINFAVQHPERLWALAVVDSSLSGYAWSATFRERLGRARGARPDRGIPLDPPALGRLGAIRVPTLALVGERDTADFHGIAEAIERGVPGARRVVIPGAGHVPVIETPAEFEALLVEFLDGARPPGAGN